MTLPGRLSAPRSPRFFWPGVAILLPIVALAAAGIASLAKDRTMVEEEARQRVQASLNFLAPVLNRRVGEALEELAQLQLAWHDRRVAELTGPVEEGPKASRLAALFPGDPAQLVTHWTARYPELKPAEVLPMRLPLASAENQPEDVPKPPLWFTEFTPEVRSLWEQARAISATGLELAKIETACQAFFHATSNSQARLNAEVFRWLGRQRLEPNPGSMGQLQSLATRDPGACTETGLPLSAVALAAVLRLGQISDVETWLFQWLANEVLIRPSLLAPVLLNACEAIGRSSPSATPVLSRIERLDEVWQADERARQLLAGLRQAGHSPDDRAFTNAWFDCAGDRWLAMASAATTPVSTSPAHSSQSVERAVLREVRLVPRRYLQVVVARALREDAPAAGLPGYADVAISLGGESIRPDAAMPSRSPAKPLALLAKREATLTRAVNGDTLTKRDTGISGREASLEDYPGEPRLAVSLVLARPELLYAQHQRRVWWFGSLILGAASVAIVGFALTRRAYLRQVRLNEAKSNFVASVSHELRAPIASVRLLAEGLERGAVRDEARQSEYFRLIVQECRRLSGLIENILDFSRIDQARKEYEFEPTDLGELTRQTIQLMVPYATERKVTLELAIKDETIVVEADGKAIQQALVNLVDNAVKHSPSGAVVTIGLEALRESGLVNASGKPAPGAARVALWVKDQGPGIPPAEQGRIFQAFYRLGSELRRETQGVGIGLSIVKHIVEAHRGVIQVESEAGQGSRFTIQLPVSQSDGLRKAKPC